MSLFAMNGIANAYQFIAPILNDPIILLTVGIIVAVILILIALYWIRVWDREQFYCKCSSKWLIRIQKIWESFHRCAQFIRDKVRGRCFYVIIFIIAIGICFIVIAIQTDCALALLTIPNNTLSISCQTSQVVTQNSGVFVAPGVLLVNNTYFLTNLSSLTPFNGSCESLAPGVLAVNASPVFDNVSILNSTVYTGTNTSSFGMTQTLPGSGTFIPTVVTSLLSFYGILAIFVTYFILLIVIGFFRYRTFLVIDDFDDFSGEKDPTPYKGIGHLLLVEMNKLTQLYLDVYEQRPISVSSGQGRQVSPVMKVDDFGTSLNQAVATNSTVNIGGIFSFPLGVFVSIFNYLGRGPRIRGSIRKGEGDSLLILASCSGFDQNFGWKVCSRTNDEIWELVYTYEDEDCPKILEMDKSESPKDKTEKIDKIVVIKTDTTELKPPAPAKIILQNNLPVEKMAYILANKIMCDLSSKGSSRWEATMLFHQGLAKYRTCIRTPKDQTLNLNAAARFFDKALTYDNKFTTAWYNLGVVHSELGRKKAADKAFARVTALEEHHPEAYLGRALALYTLHHGRMIDSRAMKNPELLPTTNDYKRDVIRFCEQTKTLLYQKGRPFSWLQKQEFLENKVHQLALSYRLMGLAFFDMAELSDSPQQTIIYLKYACCNFNLAVAAAWKDYYQFDPSGSEDDYYRIGRHDELCKFLAACMSDLGLARIWYVGEKRKQNLKNLLELSYLDNSDDIEYLFKTADSLNSRLSCDAICAEVHARFGLWYLVKGSESEAAKEFTESVRINPEIMKYHALRLLPCFMERDKISQNRPYSLKKALELAVDAFEAEREHLDEQWHFIYQVNDLLGAILKKPHLAEKVWLFNYMVEIQDFLKKNYCANQMLDYYSSDRDSEIGNLVEELNDQENRFGYELIHNWICGQYKFAKARLFNYQAFYHPELEIDDVEELYNNAIKAFKEANNLFSEFDDDRRRVISRLALIQGTHPKPDYCDALFEATTARGLYPMGDYEHVVLGSINATIKNYKQAIELTEEALFRSFDIPRFSQYIFTRYYSQITYSYMMLAKTEETPEKRMEYYQNSQKFLSHALNTFTFGYEKVLEPDEFFIDKKYQKLRKEKADEFMKNIMAVHFRKGRIFALQNNYNKAIEELQIVKTYYSSLNNCMEIHSQELSGLREYVLTLQEMGDTYFKNFQYAEALSCYDEVLSHQNDILPNKNSKEEQKLFGRTLYGWAHPYEILINVYLNKAAILLKLGICKTKGKSVSKILDNIRKYHECDGDANPCLLKKFKRVCQKIPPYSNYKKEISKQITSMESRYYLYRGILRLCCEQFFEEFEDEFVDELEHELEEECDKELKDEIKDELEEELEGDFELKSKFDKTKKYIKKSIQYDPSPEAYIFLLKTIEKQIDECDSDIADLKEQPKQNDQIKKQEKNKKSLITEASRYIEILKKLKIPSDYQEYFDEISKKFKKLSVSN